MLDCWYKYYCLIVKLKLIAVCLLVHQARPFFRYAGSGWGENVARKESSTGHD